MSGFFRALSGWLAGCGAATVVIVGFSVILTLSEQPRASLLAGPISILLGPSLLVFIVTCVITAFPAMFLILMSVGLRVRSAAFFCAVGAALGALSISLLARSTAIWTSGVGWLFAAAGLAAGVIYRLIAGRYAICERSV